MAPRSLKDIPSDKSEMFFFASKRASISELHLVL